MDEGLAVPLLAWLAVTGTTMAAVLFGQSARDAVYAYPVRRVPSRVRTGIALSISGPLLAAGVGVTLGALTGGWLWGAIVAFAGVVAASIAGLVLAPR